MWTNESAPLYSRTGHRPAPPIQGMGPADPLIFNCAEVRAGEVPSAGVHASARGLARLGSLMSRGGREADLELLSPSAWAELHSDPSHRHMVFHHNTFTKGGLAYFTPHQEDQRIDRVTTNQSPPLLLVRNPRDKYCLLIG